MKKKLLLAFVSVVMMSLVAYSSYQNDGQTVLSDVAMENVEALATEPINPDCPNGCLTTQGKCHCYDDYGYEEAKW